MTHLSSTEDRMRWNYFGSGQVWFYTSQYQWSGGGHPADVTGNIWIVFQQVKFGITKDTKRERRIDLKVNTFIMRYQRKQLYTREYGTTICIAGVSMACLALLSGMAITGVTSQLCDRVGKRAAKLYATSSTRFFVFKEIYSLPQGNRVPAHHVVRRGKAKSATF